MYEEVWMSFCWCSGVCALGVRVSTDVQVLNLRCMDVLLMVHGFMFLFVSHALPRFCVTYYASSCNYTFFYK